MRREVIAYQVVLVPCVVGEEEDGRGGVRPYVKPQWAVMVAWATPAGVVLGAEKVGREEGYATAELAAQDLPLVIAMFGSREGGGDHDPQTRRQ